MPSSKTSTAACAPLVHVNMHCRAMGELLNETLFPSLHQARVPLAAWSKDYNIERPHSRLRWQTPADFAQTPPRNGA
jgi:transposase InsO family protein